jgi:hypothetical protein
MGEKRIGSGSFADAFMAPGVGRNARLDRIEGLFHWSRFEPLLKPVRPEMGRKGYPASSNGPMATGGCAAGGWRGTPRGCSYCAPP